MRKADIDKALATWMVLNEVVMSLTDEQDLEQMLATERTGRQRKMFLLRIHSRLNKLRAGRERKEIIPNE